jgi:predicted RNase H-like HicB family nuclease
VRNYTAVIEKDPTTGTYVGYVPGWPGAHSQHATVEELRDNLREVVEMLLEDGEPEFSAEYVGTATVRVA